MPDPKTSDDWANELAALARRMLDADATDDAHALLVGASVSGFISAGRAAEIAGKTTREWYAIERAVLMPTTGPLLKGDWHA